MFEWDEAKRASNRLKHGVDFAAVTRFEFETALIEIDDRFDYGEVRLVAIGFIGIKLHVLTYTERDLVTRVISLRPAKQKEVKTYVRYYRP